MNEDSVRLELLTASMKLFFKRPPEMQKMLGRLLESSIADSRVHIKDRAMMYYRLLKTSISEAQRVVSCPPVPVEEVVEEADQIKKNQIFSEFNSLSVVYNKPASAFLAISGEGEGEDDDEEKG